MGRKKDLQTPNQFQEQTETLQDNFDGDFLRKIQAGFFIEL